MPNKTHSNPFVEWRLQNPHSTLTTEQNQRVDQLVTITIMMNRMFDKLEDEIEPWLKGLSKNEADLVKYISQYGFILEVTGNWTEHPIDIPADQLEEWKKHSGVLVTMEQIESWRAGIAGGVGRMLQLNLSLTVQTIKNQLHQRYEALADMSTQSIRKYTPTQWDPDEIGEDYTGQEIERLDRIFEAYEELYCFEQGIEMLRMIMITEEAPKFNVPSKEFYDALVSIDSQTLMEVLHLAEPKLKEILTLWSTMLMEYSGRTYYREDPEAPDTFWWRHWKVPVRQKPKNKRSNGHGRGSHK